MRYQSHLLAVTLAATALQAQSRVEAIMDRFSPSEPSVSVAVIDNGKFTMHTRGLANLEAGVKATSATNYRLASLTKQFTAAAILLLVQDGKLRLHDKIGQFFPGCPEYAKSISVRNLLTHTGGLWDYEDIIPATQKTPFKDSDAVRFSFSHPTPAFDAGAKFQYSNTGYAALSEIVRIVSGMPFRTFLKTRIFDPAGMNGTVAFEDGINTIANRAYGYTGTKRTDQDITSGVLGDGGIYSSISDMIRWNEALEKAQLLSRDLLDDATRGSVMTRQYGYGWFVDPYGKHQRHWHAGETIGFRTAIQRFPDRKLTVIVLSNNGKLDARKLSLAIADLYLNDAPPLKVGRYKRD